MKKINLFYPAHDLALAKGVRHFTPPVAARRLAEDLAALAPLWQPEEGTSPVPLPWGWNYNTCKALREAGIPADLLPTTQDLETLRRLSSRTSVIGLLQAMREAELPGAVHADLPLALESVEALEHEVAARAGEHYLLKSPWSSSGRGLSWSRVMPREALLRRGAAVIREMGSVLLEPEYHKVQDLAMLFYADRSGVRPVGYSMFETDAMGTYRNGLIAGNEEMERRLARWIPTEALHAVRDLYTGRLLPELLRPLEGRPYPIGYLGVDMMVYRTAEGAYRLNPCVEVNLRCTMGVVARQISDRLVAPGFCGQYLIEHAPDAAALRNHRAEQLTAHPTLEEAGKYRRGYFPLTEIGEESQFAAAICLE
jgi:hypothetical protein